MRGPTTRWCTARRSQRLAFALLGTLVVGVLAPATAGAQADPLLTEDFQAADGSAWPAERWEIRSLDPTTDLVDVQGGRGRITVGADTVAAHARPQLSTGEAVFTVEEPPGPEPARWTAYFTAGSDNLGWSYLLRKNNTEATLNLYRESGTVIVPLGESAAPAVGGPMRVRYQLAPDAVRVRAWAPDAAEPSTWDVDVVEAVPVEPRQFAWVARTQTSPVYPTPSPKTWYLDDIAISGVAAGPPAGVAPDLTLTPQSATATLGETHTVTAAGVQASAALTFEVYRETPPEPPETATVRQLVETTVVTADESGTATHTFGATEAGDDWIVACVVPSGERCTTGDADGGADVVPRTDIPLATATVTWQAGGPQAVSSATRR
jgi:hypothetical protein